MHIPCTHLQSPHSSPPLSPAAQGTQHPQGTHLAGGWSFEVSPPCGALRHRAGLVDGTAQLSKALRVFIMAMSVGWAASGLCKCQLMTTCALQKADVKGAGGCGGTACTRRPPRAACTLAWASRPLTREPGGIATAGPPGGSDRKLDPIGLKAKS